MRRHIEAAIDQLSEFPFLGRATDEPSVRVLLLTRYPYLIFYTVIGGEAVILHVRHGARRPIDPSELTKD